MKASHEISNLLDMNSLSFVLWASEKYPFELCIYLNILAYIFLIRSEILPVAHHQLIQRIRISVFAKDTMLKRSESFESGIVRKLLHGKCMNGLEKALLNKLFLEIFTGL